MGTHIDLDAKLRELDRKKDPTTLTLRGRTYTFQPVIPFEAAAKLGAAPERDVDADGWRKGVIEFITVALIEPDRADWVKATKDKMAFPDPLLDETIARLADEYVARPTPPSTGSSPSQAPSGRPSKSARTRKGSATSAA